MLYMNMNVSMKKKGFSMFLPRPDVAACLDLAESGEEDKHRSLRGPCELCKCEEKAVKQLAEVVKAMLFPEEEPRTPPC